MNPGQKVFLGHLLCAKFWDTEMNERALRSSQGPDHKRPGDCRGEASHGLLTMTPPLQGWDQDPGLEFQVGKNSYVWCLEHDRQGASQAALVVTNPPANAGYITDAGSMPGLGRSPGEEMATHSSILAGKIPWTEEQGVGPDWATNTEGRSN